MASKSVRYLAGFGCPIAVLLSTTSLASAQSPFNWTGYYVGGLLGVGQTSTDASLSSLGDGPPGWGSDGVFIGDVFLDMERSFVDLGPFSQSDRLEIVNVAPWPAPGEVESRDWTGTGLIGAQWMNGNLVFGAELRGTFGDLGASASDAWVSVGDVLGSSIRCGSTGSCLMEGRIPEFGLDPDATWTDPGTPPIKLNDTVTIDGTYQQSGIITAGLETGAVLSPVARFGVTADRFMIFGLAGPSWASVKATTSASLTETGTVFTNALSGSVGDLNTSGNASYSWSGENRKTLFGYTFGGGVELATTNRIIVRFEATYTDLGSIDVTGVERAGNAASYKVRQDFSNFTASGGLILKF